MNSVEELCQNPHKLKYYFACARRYLKSSDKIEDIVHEAIVKCYGKKIDNFDHYFKSTIKNLCLNEIARVEHRYSYTSIPLDEGDEECSSMVPEALRTKNTPESIVSKRQQKILIKNFMKSLPKGQRVAFNAYILKDMTLVEGAKYYKSNYNTFKVSCHIAIKKWKELYG